MSEPQYFLDSNIFIEAKQKFYAFDICPAFWDAMEEQYHNSRIFSIDKVHDELAKGKDQLLNWIKKIPKGFFLSCNDEDVQNSYAEIIRTVQNEITYLPQAKHEFTRVADAWLIAYAHAKKKTIVSFESRDKTAKKKVLIPVICEQFKMFRVLIFIKCCGI